MEVHIKYPDTHNSKLTINDTRITLCLGNNSEFKDSIIKLTNNIVAFIKLNNIKFGKTYRGGFNRRNLNILTVYDISKKDKITFIQNGNSIVIGEKFLKKTSHKLSATVVKIKSLDDSNLKNTYQTDIEGNLIVVPKTTVIGEVGLYFPVGTRIHKDFLKNNNLFKKSIHNKDNTKTGYFGYNGLVRKMGISNGFYINIDCLDYIDNKENFKVGDRFKIIGSKRICY